MADITADMLISEVLSVCPHAADVFEAHGLGCGGCLAASMESLSAVATVHGVPIALLVDELNLASKARDERQSGKESDL